MLQICQKFVDPACVAASNIAACIKQDQDEAYFLTHPRPSPPKLAPAAIAGIAVGAAAAFVALLVAAFLYIRKAKHAKQQQQKMAALLPTAAIPKHLKCDSSSGSGSSGSPRGSSGSRRSSKDSTDSFDSLVMPKSIQMTSDCGRGGSSDSGSSCKVLAVGMGSPSVMKTRAAGLPSIVKGTLTEEEAADVQLGELTWRKVGGGWGKEVSFIAEIGEQ